MNKALIGYIVMFMSISVGAIILIFESPKDVRRFLKSNKRFARFCLMVIALLSFLAWYYSDVFIAPQVMRYN